MNIRKILFDYKCSKEPKRNAAFPTYAQARSILLLYESEWQERNPEIKSMIQQWHDEDKQVMSWGYCKKDKILSPNLPDSRMLGTKDFNFLDMPKSEVVQSLQRHTFDIMVDLTTTPVLPMQYIAMLADARFKIGAHIESPIYDMYIQPNAECTAEYLYRQMVHYMKTIKSADRC